MSFERTFGDRYGKKLMDTATKTRIDAAKTASKQVVKNTAEATVDLTGNKIADKITSVSKTKSKEKEDEWQENYIAPEKRRKIDDLRLFWHHINTTADEVPRFIIRKWIEVPEQSGSAEDRYKASKQIRFKTSRLRSDLCDFSDAYIVVKGRVTANFNIRRVDYINNDFSDAHFSDNIFL